jgi:hypothetical protein
MPRGSGARAGAVQNLGKGNGMGVHYLHSSCALQVRKELSLLSDFSWLMSADYYVTPSGGPEAKVSGAHRG